MSTLSQFLLDKKQAFLADLSSNQGEGWTIVMGNEAGDLDSCASALAYSYLSTTLDQTRTIALIQTLRADLHLRPENELAFQFAHLDPDNANLLTTDDITSSLPLPTLRTSFVLVDHNTINPKFLNNPQTDPTQEDRVKAIFDHHDDDHHHQSASPRIIREPEPVAGSAGSCTSIIADYFHTRFPQASSITPHSAWSDVATLLLSAIAIDTNGLKAGGKAQEVDRTSSDFLYPISAFGALSISGDGTSNPESKTIPDLTKILSHRKGDVSGLPGQDLLRRDYKEYNYTTTNASQVRVGLSTVPMSLNKWLKRDGAATFWADQDAWIAKRELAVSGVLCAFETKEKEHKREMLLVFSSNASTALEGQLYAGLEGNAGLDVVRRDLDGLVEGKRARAWEQRKAQATRKQIEPAIKAIIQGS
ncbi:DHH phosphoesterase [Ceratobasidium sp. AG-I]|nr:DHH phosphoesterase [Ceratobasidium sp. AG-I]